MERKVPLGNWFSRILDAIRAETNTAMKPYGIDNTGFAMLYGLFIVGEGMTQAQLTEYLFIDKAATSRTIDSLETLGHLQRQPSPTDARKKLIYLTDQGKALEPVITKVYDTIYQNLIKGLQKRDVLKTLDTLRQISDNATLMRLTGTK
jgi:DNA-binding MarR family transcriptional regulator